MSALLSFFAVASAAPAEEDPVKFIFNNWCPFPVYIREAVAEHPGPRHGEGCANFGETKEGILPAGAGFMGQYPVYKDSCGHSGE